ncbi:MAG: hypothetical protein MZV63_72070 [Marinilabiliales bacterium]|nr:hypothetical protein [Marinilabiliales bacterium]
MSMPKQCGLAVFGAHLPGQHFDGGRFASAIGSEETQDFTFGNVKVDVVDGEQIPVTVGQVFGNNGVIGHGFLLVWVHTERNSL